MLKHPLERRIVALRRQSRPYDDVLRGAWVGLHSQASPFPPAPVHRGLLHAQTGDRGLPEEVQRQEETEGNRSSQYVLLDMGVAWPGWPQ